MEKNLRDSTTNTSISVKDIYFSVSYTKTNKLITALYMVTDIIEKDEPLRNKLRMLGAEVISDMHSTPLNVCSKVSQIMSFLDIAATLNIISEMNCNILKKEFSKLNQSILNSNGVSENLNRSINLSEFFSDEDAQEFQKKRIFHKGHSIGHQISTRLGVQKGSTLMQALSGVKVSDKIDSNAEQDASNFSLRAQDFDILKKERRYEITNFIKKNGGSATITDIKNSAQGVLISCSEKTLQRELMSMTKDGVLNKTGEKRWSRYSL